MHVKSGNGRVAGYRPLPKLAAFGFVAGGSVNFPGQEVEPRIDGARCQRSVYPADRITKPPIAVK